ncbi:hypothetical protein IW141_004099 [Coemansia sp. RSA 355]|nr:hypothetical protein IW144_003129 [Coemansia sp. RSA 522]KAJ2288956.1 hypothetical protein IW141_004099 [Coemansia sp. RSA 355]
MPAPEHGQSPTSGLYWHPASVLPKRHSQGLLTEPFAPTVLRPAMRIPGFLKLSRGLSYQEMVNQFRKLHSDIDIPHDIIAEAFSEAAADNTWEGQVPSRGNTIACCRPALDEAGLGENDASFKEAAAFCHKREVRPLLQSIGIKNSQELDTELKWSSHREWAVYAGGECCNELWTLPLPSANDGSLRDLGFWPQERMDMPISDTEVHPSLEFTTPIRQILAHDSHPGRVCVRTDSMVCMVNMTQHHSGLHLIPRIDASVVGCPYTYDSGDRWTCHASWNPWHISELALASGTGCVRLWDCTTGNATLLRDTDTVEHNTIQWNCCEYWSCPRQLLCANPDILYMLDVRAKKSETALVTLKDSPFGYKNEVFTAICPSALHPLHAIAASTHAIRVFDQRYLKQPILAWEHAHLPFDPPIFLQSTQLLDSDRGRRAGIFAATENSSRIYGYVYGQNSSDQPYTSLDQFMLRPMSSTANVFDTIQNPLAIDPHENQDFTTGHTYVANYPTGRLTGCSFRLMASKHISQAAFSDSPLHEAVCISLDEFGTVVGHKIAISSNIDDSSTADMDETVSRCSFDSNIWKNTREINGAIVDGMDLVLQTKAERDLKKETLWAELRKRGEVYERVDMADMYQYLINGSDGREFQDLPEIYQTLQTRLESVQSKDISAYEIINVVRALQPGEQPIPVDSSQSVRNRLLYLSHATEHSGAKGSLHANIIEALRAGETDTTYSHDGASLPSIAPCEADVQALQELFSLPSTHAQKSLVRAAEDIELSRARVRQKSFETEDTAILEHSDAGSAKLNLELDSKLNGLGSTALLLDSLWAGNAIDMEGQTQRHTSLPSNGISDSQPARGSRRKSKQTDHSTERSAAWPATSPAVSATAPLSSHSRREASAAVYTAPSSVIDVFASSQKPSSSTQPKASQAKKKKARKSGF